MITKFFRIIILMQLSLCLISCSESTRSTTIHRISSNPRDYEGRVLTITGEVTGGLGIPGFSGFVLQDSTGEIGVVTSRATPNIGTQISIHGTIMQLFAFGNERITVFCEEPLKP